MSEYLTAAGSLVMSGPTGIMVSLGIEYVVGMALTTAYMYYNYISVCLMFFIAAMAGARSESRFLIVLPIMGGIFLWFGWIQTGTPDTQLQFLMFLIIAALLGIFSYMNDVNHEKYGVAGPGSKLLNIVFFLILFQAAVGVISGFNLFDAGTAQPVSNVCTVGYQCDAYGNIMLSESVGTIGETGGLFQSAIGILTALPMLAIGILKMLITILISIVAFPLVLNASISSIYPGISSNMAYIGFLALMQVGIWAVYLMTIFAWYYKPTPGEGTL
jgi:hypothetical protein